MRCPRTARRNAGVRAAGPIAILVIAAICIGPGSARAHIVSDREVLILLGMPKGIVADLVEPPDGDGDAGPNRAGWDRVDHQTDALLILIDACARSDSALAEAAWKGIDAAFLHQRPAGDYETARAESRLEQLKTAWWIAQLCRAEIVVTNSPLQKRFQWRVALMRPKLRRSVDWLVAAGDELLLLHAAHPELLLVDAQAYLLADGIYHEPRFAELGQRALADALRGQRKDGAFVSDARDVGGQARAVVGLLEIAIYFPMPMLEEKADRGALWLARHLPKVLGGPNRSRGRGRSEAQATPGMRQAGSVAVGRAVARPGRGTDAIMALAYQASRTKNARLLHRLERLALESPARD